MAIHGSTSYDQQIQGSPFNPAKVLGHSLLSQVKGFNPFCYLETKNPEIREGKVRLLSDLFQLHVEEAFFIPSTTQIVITSVKRKLLAAIIISVAAVALSAYVFVNFGMRLTPFSFAVGVGSVLFMGYMGIAGCGAYWNKDLIISNTYTSNRFVIAEAFSAFYSENQIEIEKFRKEKPEQFNSYLARLNYGLEFLGIEEAARFLILESFFKAFEVTFKEIREQIFLQAEKEKTLEALKAQMETEKVEDSKVLSTLFELWKQEKNPENIRTWAKAVGEIVDQLNLGTSPSFAPFKEWAKRTAHHLDALFHKVIFRQWNGKIYMFPFQTRIDAVFKK